MIEILPYHVAAASYHEWDPRAPHVADAVIQHIEMDNPAVSVEHIGSTSVPGCGGKGIVDLMLMYPPGGLEVARSRVDVLGFQHQTSRDPFPEERPMRVAAVRYDDEEFKVHLHIIAADSPEVVEFRVFRESLRRDVELMNRYMRRKQEILADGITDSTDYAHTKGAFCRDVLARALT